MTKFVKDTSNIESGGYESTFELSRASSPSLSFLIPVDADPSLDAKLREDVLGKLFRLNELKMLFRLYYIFKWLIAYLIACAAYH